MESVREGYIEVTGGKVWYREVGCGRKGIPLLILHGGPGASHDYLEPLAELSVERPVVFYDQLGCGNSDRPDDLSLWTVARYVEELENVRQALDLDRVHLLGQSWGSMLAVEYMLTKKPSGVTALIFSGPSLSASRFQADQKAYLSRMPEEFQKAIREAESTGNFESPPYQDAMMAYYKRHVCRLDPWPHCLKRTIEKFGHAVYRHMWGPSEFTITGTLWNYEREDRLEDISWPVLF
jgi:proline iminopeptidase